MNARCVDRAQNRNRLAPHFNDAYGRLRLLNVCAQSFVELLLGLLHSHSGYVNSANKRNLHIALAVNSRGLVCKPTLSGSRDFYLMVGPQNISSLARASTTRL